MALKTWLHLSVPVALGAGLLFAATASAQSPTTTSTPVATVPPPATTPTPPLATCPAGMTIAVAPPTAQAPTTVSVTTSPQVTIKAAAAADPQSIHLHYFIDVNPLEVLKPGGTVPFGNPRIIHSANVVQDLGALTPGDHRVWVVAGRLDHVPCDPLVVGTTTFTVAPPPTPIAPRTGSGAGEGDGGAPTGLVPVALVIIAGAGALAATRAVRR